MDEWNRPTPVLRRLSLTHATQDKLISTVYFVGDTEQRYRSITFWVSNGLHWLWDSQYKNSSADLENFESTQAGRKEIMYNILNNITTFDAIFEKISCS